MKGGIVLDASPIVAILRREEERERFGRIIVAAERCSISAATYVEAAVVLDCRRDPFLSREFDRFMSRSNVYIEPVTARQAEIARDAYRDFGKGLHPASLNFGDCFAYALAKDRDEPLLFKGDDFSKTDVRRC